MQPICIALSKRGSQWKILEFICQYIPKTIFLMTILAVRGGGKNLVINRNFIVKKWKFENFEQNSCYIPQKKAKNKYNSESGWKSKILEKKNKFLNFFWFFPEISEQKWFF